jgi:hypothetical protein
MLQDCFDYAALRWLCWQMRMDTKVYRSLIELQNSAFYKVGKIADIDISM